MIRCCAGGAVMALLSAGMCTGQTLVPYGNVDLAFGGFERNAPGEDLQHRLVRVESGVTSGTFVGIKGKEPLGEGWVAQFKLESGVSADVGKTAADFWERTCELGVASGQGELTLGRSLSLSFRANLMNSPFTVFRPLGLIGVTNFGPFQPNTVTWSSPEQSGLRIALQYGASEGAGQSPIRAWQGQFNRGATTVHVTHSGESQQALWQVGASHQASSWRWFAQYARATSTLESAASFHVHLGVAAPLSERDTLLTAWTHTDRPELLHRDNVAAVWDHRMGQGTSVYAGLVWQRSRDIAQGDHGGHSAMLGMRFRF